jgi:hypothetical protein
VTTDVATTGFALKYASDLIGDNDAVVTAAVKKNGFAMKYTSDRITNDYTIVAVAVKQDGHALEYASNRLKANEVIVAAAVEQDGEALQHASDRLKNDKLFQAASKRDRDAARTVFEDLVASGAAAAAASTEDEADAMRFRIAFLARVFAPHLDDAAQDASAALDHPGTAEARPQARPHRLRGRRGGSARMKPFVALVDNSLGNSMHR